jgi:hypothetical protein
MSSRYDKPPWKPVNEIQFDVRLSAFGPRTSSVIGRKRPERLTKTMENKKQGKEEHTIKKRILSQNTAFSAE